MQVDTSSVHNNAATLLRGQSLSHVTDFAFDQITVRICSNSESVLDDLRRYLHVFETSAVQSPDIHIDLIDGIEAPADLPWQVVPPSPGKTRIKDETLDLPDGRMVRKRRTGMFFLMADGVNVAGGPCGDNLNQVVNFINNRVAQRYLDRGYILCHCAAVAEGDRGIALAGLSGRGKSTLALRLIGDGMDFVSNDRIMIAPDGDPPTLAAFAKFPRVNPGTILNQSQLHSILDPVERDRLTKLPQDELWHLEDKYDVDIESCFGRDRCRLSVPLSLLVILTWHLNGGDTVARKAKLADRPDLLNAVMKDAGAQQWPIDPPTRRTAPEDYIVRLANTPVLEISGGVDFAAASAICRTYLNADSNY